MKYLKKIGNNARKAFEDLKEVKHENRCMYIKKDGNRCKFRKSHKSEEYCGMHWRIAYEK